MRHKQDGFEDWALAHLTAAAVALEFGFQDMSLLKLQRGRKANERRARQIVLYVLHVTYDMNLSKLGRLFDLHRTTVFYACNVIEDDRDDPVFDDKIRRLEQFLIQTPPIYGTSKDVNEGARPRASEICASEIEAPFQLAGLTLPGDI